MNRPERSRLSRGCLTASAVVLLAAPPVSRAQECPAGGVLDDGRAYFGSTLAENVCERAGDRCRDVYFFSEQLRATAVCEAGRWRPLETLADPSACPRFVFSVGEVWRGGDYVANSCVESTAPPLCAGVFFDRLPEGGAGYRPAICEDGSWRPVERDAELPTLDPRSNLRRVTSADELRDTLREGLLRTYTGQSEILDDLLAPGVGGGPSGQPNIINSDWQIPISGTNVLEAGVDEEDRIETDGRLLFVLRNGQTRREPITSFPRPPRVRVLEIDPQAATAEAIGELTVPIDEDQFARGLYLRGAAKRLTVTASNRRAEWIDWYNPFAWRFAESSIITLDVTRPADLDVAGQLLLTGDIVSSRRIGDILYVATRFHPLIRGLQPFEPGDPGATEKQFLIATAPLSELLPTYRTSPGGASRLLVEPEDCYLPPEGTPIRTADVVALAAIDLDSMSVTSSRCFVGATETLYASLGSIYLASTRYDYTFVPSFDNLTPPQIDFGSSPVETDVHKFSLTGGGISYRGSGVVDGHLGFDVLRRPFRMSEHGRDLRVITYTDELTPDRSPAALTILRDLGSGLAVLSRLPNQRHPEPLGKPGEELYATRFVGDHGFLVTFRIIDPLYLLDLSDPRDPFLAGELEIPGYSEYLHPLGGGYLLGVGKDAIPGEAQRGAFPQGVKVSLFDVSDPSAPYEADSVDIGRRGSDADVLRDHRAFTFLAREGERPRFAFGVRVHERTGSGTQGRPWTTFDWSHSGLHLFEVDTANGRLLPMGDLRAERYGGEVTRSLWGEDRSVLAGDVVFYVHGDDVYTSTWANPEVAEGPR